MAEPLEPWIVATQNSLGAVISAPKLTDKLLRKPPFRFLHDIVTNFIKAANFPVGFFSDDLLDSGKCTEKEQKLEFLTKLVTVVQIATGKQTAARPAKIIAGADPEGTNDLLQMFAQCAALSQAQKDSAVKKANGAASDPAPAPAPAPAAAAPAPAPAPAPAAQPQQEAPNVVVERKPKPTAAPAATEEAPPAKPAHRSSRSKQESPPPSVVETRPAPTREDDTVRGGVPQVTPLGALGQQGGDRPGTASARKAPPKSVNNEVSDNRSEPVNPVAGVIVETKRGAKAGDDEDANKDQDWMKLVEEHENARSGASGSGAGANTEEAKGYLGQQALKAKREQEEAARKAAEEARAADGTTGGLVLAVQKRDKAGSALGDGELNKLREQLQMLTKASNPLGSFLEAIQEDIDTMSRELEMWRSEARAQAVAAREAQRETELSLHEVHVQQQSLEDSISDQITKTNMLRAKILENEKTVETMVRMVVNPESAKAPAAGAKR